MKNPDEIKKGLEYLQITDVSEKIKAAKRGLNYSYVEDVARDALALIQQLEKKALDLGEYMELSDFLGDRVKELEAQVPRWISVEERLPENFATVIIFREDCRNACIGWLIGGSWSVPKGVRVTHWMPLPEPPKEDAQ